MARKGRRDHWNEMRASVEEMDDLPTRASGSWAGNKLWHWNRYIEITTNAMADNPKWQGLTYVDLFAGPGVCTIRETKERLPGSPIIAASAPKKFRKILLCELDVELADACEARLLKRISPDQFKVFRGNCNTQIRDLVSWIPSGSLTLAFLDPTGLHLEFATIEVLTSKRAVDLLVLFPDSVDILRNEAQYFSQTDSNLDRTLGPNSEWRERRRLLNTQEPADLRKLYVSIYRDQLSRLLGYKYSDDVTIRGPRGPLYRLVYATRHEMGLKFWRESCKKELSGQSLMF